MLKVNRSIAVVINKLL